MYILMLYTGVGALMYMREAMYNPVNGELFCCPIWLDGHMFALLTN